MQSEQSEINIGLVGHVDHGKTSLTKALSGKWTDTHSEELKRGITIRVGYADTAFYKNEKSGKYLPEHQIPKDQKDIYKLARRVSFLDAPGHETLMATMISAASVVDGALLIIAANEPCPQAQTAEHLMVLDILGIKNIVIVQNKIDLVDQKRANEHYVQIKKFTKGTVAENAPIIPISANYNANIDSLIEAIEEFIPTPKRNIDAPAKMYVARSFDINRPGQDIKKLKGGVVGGSIIQGKLKIGDKIFMLPGLLKKVKDRDIFMPLDLEVKSLNCEHGSIEQAISGGLIGIGTNMDPAVVKGDKLVGQILTADKNIGEIAQEPQIEYSLIKREGYDNPPLRMGEPLVISVGTATSIGAISKLKGSRLTIKLKRALFAESGAKVALSRKMDQRWRLSAFGTIA
ncbi:MAG: translation initiation factor IF-2 subunit gamma [Candidatus Micrarchaeota archaeon]